MRTSVLGGYFIKIPRYLLFDRRSGCNNQKHSWRFRGKVPDVEAPFVIIEPFVEILTRFCYKILLRGRWSSPELSGKPD